MNLGRAVQVANIKKTTNVGRDQQQNNSNGEPD